MFMLSRFTYAKNDDFPSRDSLFCFLFLLLNGVCKLLGIGRRTVNVCMCVCSILFVLLFGFFVTAMVSVSYRAPLACYVLLFLLLMKLSAT